METLKTFGKRLNFSQFLLDQWKTYLLGQQLKITDAFSFYYENSVQNFILFSYLQFTKYNSDMQITDCWSTLDPIYQILSLVLRDKYLILISCFFNDFLHWKYFKWVRINLVFLKSVYLCIGLVIVIENNRFSIVFKIDRFVFGKNTIFLKNDSLVFNF